jgi:hypothetical protein
VARGTKSARSYKQEHCELLESKEYTVPSNLSISIAGELSKLAKLKEGPSKI